MPVGRELATVCGAGSANENSWFAVARGWQHPNFTSISGDYLSSHCENESPVARPVSGPKHQVRLVRLGKKSLSACAAGTFAINSGRSLPAERDVEQYLVPIRRPSWCTLVHRRIERHAHRHISFEFLNPNVAIRSTL